MNLLERIKYYLFNLSILWNANDFYMGSSLASFLAVPIVIILRLVHSFSIDLFYITLFCIKITIFTATFIGLKITPVERFKSIILPKVFGFMIAMMFIRGRFLNYMLVGVLFNTIHTLLYKQFYAKGIVSSIIRDNLDFNAFWEKYFILFSNAIAAGLATNIIFNVFRFLSLIF